VAEAEAEAEAEAGAEAEAELLPTATIERELAMSTATTLSAAAYTPSPATAAAGDDDSSRDPWITESQLGRGVQPRGHTRFPRACAPRWDYMEAGQGNKARRPKVGRYHQVVIPPLRVG
jgi:hypothetical protein